MLLSEEKWRKNKVNYNAFIGSKIINKNGEQGEVVSFTKDRIVIAYPGGEKTYNPEVAIRNGFLSFVDEELSRQYSEELNNKDKAKKEQEEIAKRIDADRPIKIQRVNKLNQQYVEKIRVLQALFGDDFIYPPYVEFVKKYKELIKVKKSIFEEFSDYWRFGYKYQ